MTTKRTAGPGDCFARALPDEPYLVLLGRDKHAPGLVDRWADFREGEVEAGNRPEDDRGQVEDARQVARDMRAWRKANDGSWRGTSGALLTADELERQADAFNNAAFRLRYDSWPAREGEAGPMFDSFGRDPRSWNIQDDETDDDDEDPAAAIGDLIDEDRPYRAPTSDGSNRPGVSLVGNALMVWVGLQRGRPSVATAAAVFNLPPHMIVEAVGDAYLAFLSGDPNDPAACYIEQDGE